MCYLLRIQQYPVNTTYNNVAEKIIAKKWVEKIEQQITLLVEGGGGGDWMAFPSPL